MAQEFILRHYRSAFLARSCSDCGSGKEVFMDYAPLAFKLACHKYGEICCVACVTAVFHGRSVPVHARSFSICLNETSLRRIAFVQNAQPSFSIAAAPRSKLSLWRMRASLFEKQCVVKFIEALLIDNLVPSKFRALLWFESSSKRFIALLPPTRVPHEWTHLFIHMTSGMRSTGPNTSAPKLLAGSGR